jgi:hypothetical protein
MFSSNKKNFFNFILIFKQKKFKSLIISFFTQYESLIYSFSYNKDNFKTIPDNFSKFGQKIYIIFLQISKKGKNYTLIQIYFVSENYNILHIIKPKLWPLKILL